MPPPPPSPTLAKIVQWVKLAPPLAPAMVMAPVALPSVPRLVVNVQFTKELASVPLCQRAPLSAPTLRWKVQFTALTEAKSVVERAPPK